MTAPSSTGCGSAPPVCGVFESGALVENGAVVMDLPLLQEVTENRGKVNFLNLRLDPSLTEAQRESLKSSIRAAARGTEIYPFAQTAET